MQRTQIYLAEQQQVALARLAKDRRTTSSALIREALDEYLAARLSPAERLARLRELGTRFESDRSAASAGLADTAADPEARDSAALVDGMRATDRRRLDFAE